MASSCKGYYRPGVQLKDYQRDGSIFAFIKRRASLIMGKGTGKTITALNLIKLSKPINVFIGTGSKASVENWYRQIAKFTFSKISWDQNGIRTIIIGNRTRVYIRVYNPYHYNPLPKIDLFVLDEFHNLKSRKAKRSKTIRRLIDRNYKARVIIMTATPTAINEVDMWFPYTLLNVFNKKWSSFFREYCENYGFFNKKVRLREEMKEEFMERVDKVTYYVSDDVLGLESEDRVVRLKFSRPNREIYEYLENEFILEFQDIQQLLPNALSKMCKLHQICGGSVYTEAGLKNLMPCEKLEWVKAFVSKREDKTVIFCAYNSEVTRIHLELNHLGVKNLTLYGGNKDKNSWMKFQDDKSIRVIVCQFMSGAESIDLYAADMAIYYSLNFRYISFDQSMGRIKRMGQRKKSKFVFLMVENSIDQIVYENLSQKGRIAQGVFNQLKKNKS